MLSVVCSLPRSVTVAGVMLIPPRTMKPKVRLPIYQTKVSTIPLYWFPPQAGGVRDGGELAVA